MPHAKDERADVYQRITDQIIAALEKGAGDYKAPWHANSGMPRNVQSGKFYRGVNVLALWATAQEKGYEHPIWGTFNQWQDKGAQVKKGEKAATVVFWKFLDGKRDGDEGSEDDEKHRRAMARAYSVFNAYQVDGFTPPLPAPLLPSTERIAHADEFFANTGAKLKHEGVRAFYRPATDEIVLPPFTVFKDAPGYYSTAFHELNHWTGAESRLARPLKNRFGDEQYAMEELQAELGACMIMADLGISPVPRQENAAYIQSWLKVLRGDKRAIFSASGQAQRAADYLHGLQPGIAVASDKVQHETASESTPALGTSAPATVSHADRLMQGRHSVTRQR